MAEWHHVTGIYDGQSIRLYIDEKLTAETECSGNILDTPFPLCIGREAESQDQGEYSGRLSSMIIDQLRIYPKAIPIDEMDDPLSKEKMVLALDFEEDHKGENFYSVGLGGRTYGIVWPGREIQPEIHQVKKSGQPITTEAIQAEKGQFRMINRHQFKNLDETDLNWELLLDGKVVENGKMDVSLEAQKQADISIPFSFPREEGEVILTISYSLKDGTSWARAGHEVAFDQFIIREAPVKVNPPVKGNIQLEEHSEQISNFGKGFQICVQ